MNGRMSRKYRREIKKFQQERDAMFMYMRKLQLAEKFGGLLDIPKYE